MEITKELIESLSADDVETICAYRELIAEAKADVEAIRELYRFCIGEDKIAIWETDDGAEYVTHSGVWQARYTNQTYDIPVNVNAVFNVYREAYENKKAPTSLRNDIADSAPYFRGFARDAKRLLGMRKEVKKHERAEAD